MGLRQRWRQLRGALWDQELNRVYAELFQKLPTQDQAILKQSEQEWLKFRDSNRKLIGEVYGQARGLKTGFLPPWMC